MKQLELFDKKHWFVLLLAKKAWTEARVKNARTRKYVIPTKEAEKRGHY